MHLIPYREAARSLMWTSRISTQKFNENEEGTVVIVAPEGYGYHLRRKIGGIIKLSALVDAEFGICPDTRRCTDGRGIHQLISSCSEVDSDIVIRNRIHEALRDSKRAR